LKTNKQNWILDDDQLSSQIILQADEKVVSFDFIALNFRNATQNRYAYRLVGYDKDWVYCGDRRFTTYTNLPAGEYVFQVKGSNNDGVWNEQGASIRIKVLPPWYLTWWAFGLYILLAGFAIRYLVVYREHIQRKKMEERRKNSELKAAQDLQKSMLPKEYPKREDLAIHAFIRASTEVGGDYYDFFEQEDGTLFVVCGDATGHGTTSGMMVSITKAGLNGIEPKMPNLILEQLNKVITRVDLGVLRMSLNIAKFDADHMYLASAAMPPMYHYVAKTGLVEEIQQINLPLGGLKKETFDLITRRFEQGDVLVQLSDGIPEAPNLAGEMFDYEALAQIIQQHGHASIQDLHAAIMEAVDTWLEGQHNPDDITLVITKKK
jgi:serine phosphatase RsbU (regulator of sigma subunit)